MKTIYLFKTMLIGLCVISLCITSCKKGDVGAQGERGEQGEKGGNGEKGTKGDNGNANVVLYEFGKQTFTGALNLQLPVSKATVDKSLVLVYYNPEFEVATAWYACPGLGSSGFYQTRFFIYQTKASPSTYQLSIKTTNIGSTSTYGSALTFNKIKVIFAEASSTIKADANGSLDLQNYQSVKAVLNLKD